MQETYCGHVRTPADAIKLFEACRLGLLPRVQRRLSEKERQCIKSGSVFVWDEREAGMRRWTDGKSWSASRVSGSFLCYREMEGKRGGGGFVPPPARRQSGKTPDSGRGSDEDMDMDADGPDGYRYKPDGLMKQSFSITTHTGQHLHLISYYARPHPNSPEMLQPTTDPALRHIVPVKGMYPEATVHEQPQGPPVTRAPMQGAYSLQHPHPQQMPPGPPRPYPYAVGPGYGWPPSPVATPPYQYANGGYPQHLPPPGSAHVSPHQHHQYVPHPSQMAPQHTVFDRAPPPLQNSSLPPPPPQQLHHLTPISGASQGSLPAISYPNHSPRDSAPPPLQIDPRITATAAAAIQQSQAQTAAHAAAAENHRRTPSNGQITPTSTNAPTAPMESPTSAAPVVQPIKTSTPHAAQTIPSISSLVHAVDSPPRGKAEPRTVPAVEAKSQPSSRAGSTSPNGTKKAEGPRDIPHAKMNFGHEDVRALRVLDRKFCI